MFCFIKKKGRNVEYLVTFHKSTMWNSQWHSCRPPHSQGTPRAKRGPGARRQRGEVDQGWIGGGGFPSTTISEPPPHAPLSFNSLRQGPIPTTLHHWALSKPSGGVSRHNRLSWRDNFVTGPLFKAALGLFLHQFFVKYSTESREHALDCAFKMEQIPVFSPSQ